MPELRASQAQSQPPYLRHFVFTPGPSERNRTGYYALSFGVFVLIALALEALADSGLLALSIDNRGLSDALAALSAHETHLPWRWLFLFFGLSYTIIAISLGAAVKLVHNRKALTLFTDRERFDGRRALAGFFLYTALLVVPLLIYFAISDDIPKPHFNASQLVELIALSCVLLIIQTSTEEALFRGYLTQFIASVTDSRGIIVVLPALLFMFAHFDNPEVAQHPQILGFYFAFGAFMSLIALRERGLELTIAAHFSNNLVNSVFFRNDDGIFQTPALFVTSDASHGAPLVASMAGLLAPVIYWLLTAIALRRR